MQHRRIAALLLASGAALAACTSSPSAVQTPPHTVTVTATRTPSPTATPTVTAPKPTPTAAPGTTAAVSPAAVVQEYYAAVDRRDYATAWRLGGDNLGSDYNTFAAGYADTVTATVTVTAVHGNQVSVQIDAVQTSGAHQHYQGVYTVDGARITGANITQVGGPTPAPVGPPSGVLLAPNGDHYRAGEFCPERYHGVSTVDAQGRTITCVAESGGYHWSYPGR